MHPRVARWDLHAHTSPPVRAMAWHVERAVTELAGDGLRACPVPPRYRFIQSSTAPRLQIENRVYETPALRKVHLEVAVRDDLQVFHSVMFPRAEYDLPILSMDLVLAKGVATLAIVDPCPVNAALTLPHPYATAIGALQATFGMASNRQVPQWGAAIFSAHCVIVRPQEPGHLAAFLAYTRALTEYHMVAAKHATLAEGAADRLEAHRRYCAMQLQNQKTSRVLSASFGDSFAHEYMREVMFDAP